jgi:hypothetical protein
MRMIVEETGGQVVTAARNIFTADGRMLGICKESNGVDFIDTNCYFLTRTAFPACAAWLFKDARESIVGDRLFWNAVQTGGYTRIHSIVPTVNYVSTLASHYEMFGEIPPDDSKMILKLTGHERFQMISYAQFKAMVGGPGR